MENTLENKAKFFALYWGQKIVRHYDWHNHVENASCAWESVFPDTKYNSYYLELKPLSSISDEDSLSLSAIIQRVFPSAKSIQDGKDFINKFISGNILFLKISQVSTITNVIDFLRSRGYALPWMGLSVEELINRGWIKLKEVKP